MAYQLNDNIPCGTEACATSKHESSACNSVDNVLISGIKDIKKGISDIEGKVDLTPLAKEATLIAKVAELKEALNSIDFTAIKQAIQDVKGVTAKEDTLILGVGDIIKAVENIDLSSVESKVEEESQAIQGKIDNIKLPEIDTTELAKESTLNAVSSKLDNINVEVDLSTVAKQGDNQEATNTAILDAVNNLHTSFDELYAGQIKDLIGE